MSTVLLKVSPFIVCLYFFQQYIKTKKKYNILGVIILMLVIFSKVSRLNNIFKLYDKSLKYISLVLVIIFLYLFLKDLLKCFISYF